MRHTLTSALLAILSAPAFAASPAPLNVHVEGLTPEGAVPEANALCVPTPDGKNGPGRNVRPSIAWSAGPEGTKSYAIVVADPDVPQDLGPADKPQPILESAPRQILYHFVQVNIPADATRLAGSEESPAPNLGVTAANSVTPATPFTYGGPCPPWNDLKLHHYHFQVIALDVPVLTLPSGANGKQVVNALSGHILANGEVVGTFTTNAQLRKTLK